jgi:hypothetical protein
LKLPDDYCRLYSSSGTSCQADILMGLLTCYLIEAPVATQLRILPFLIFFGAISFDQCSNCIFIAAYLGLGQRLFKPQNLLSHEKTSNALYGYLSLS